ncbi:PGN_0703 family putative restriction endonuclease [Acidicapsa acidisoli]|uniref:PGN_0703 family putative restriction endonuclease n=1 Tax=Acidicapsa acidisoli TaxID=1615681 RepID=UPI0021DFAD02|nr:hypothetical protein [Acidicapsa acidisoli]
MAEENYSYASRLRHELCQRNRQYATGWVHVESYGSQPVIVYAPDGGRHGNFFDDAYAAICARPEWMRRLTKIHAQARQSLPRHETGRLWRELDSSTSSDALLMNVFCTPGVVESARVHRALGVAGYEPPVFGWKARVPLRNAREDRTEVDMRWGGLLVEAKLTEADFQTRSATVVEAYRDFDEVFDRDLLPRVKLRTLRQKAAAEFPEEFSQEWEASDAPDDERNVRAAAAKAYQQAIVAKGVAQQPVEPGYAGYQLIRNVLAAYATGCSFCVMHDQRRPDLREAWFRVITAVRRAEMRVRCKVLTWQELAALLPEPLREFLDRKYGIVAVD